MAITYSGNIQLKIKGVLDAGASVGTVSQAVNEVLKYDITNGTGAGQVNMCYQAERTLAASASEELDLSGGLTDAFGNTINFTNVKYMYILADENNTNNVLVGGAASNSFLFLGNATDTISLHPGMHFSVGGTDNANGFAVTAGTGDLLKIANSAAGTSVTYRIILLGEV